MLEWELEELDGSESPTRAFCTVVAYFLLDTIITLATMAVTLILLAIIISAPIIAILWVLGLL